MFGAIGSAISGIAGSVLGGGAGGALSGLFGGGQSGGLLGALSSLFGGSQQSGGNQGPEALLGDLASLVGQLMSGIGGGNK